jgi:hypothetical protein
MTINLSARKTRTDQHRPAEFTPEDYVAVGYFYNKTSIYMLDDKGRQTDIMTPAGENMLRLLALIGDSTTTPYHTGYQCDHCGARIAYVAVFLHTPTGDHLAVGETCADGRFEMDKAEFHRLRKAAELDRAQHKILTAWRAFTEETHADVGWATLYASENGFVVDVLRRGRQYGSISEKQLNAISEAVARDAVKATEPVEDEVPSVPVPTGRYQFTGNILAIKSQESDFGPTLKMLLLVSTDEGQYKVWGTFPKSLEGVYGCTAHGKTPDDGEEWYGNGGHRFNCALGYINGAEVGDAVRLTATVTRSDRDEAFGFFSRPTKAEIMPVTYTCDECDATVTTTAKDHDTEGWYFDEDAYRCPLHVPVDLTCAETVARYT